MKKIISVVVLIAAFAGVIYFLKSKTNSAPLWQKSDGKLHIVASIFPVYDFVREVGGDNVDVRCLTTAGIDPHEYALTPRDVEMVSKADLLVINGAGLDDHLLAALTRAGTGKVNSTNCSQGLRLLSTGTSAGQGDPHLWLDVANARHYVMTISAALQFALNARNEHAKAEMIAKRTTEYLNKLETLDSEFRRGLDGIKKRDFVALHGAFAYLAARYKLNVAAVWEPSPGHEPGPKDVAALLATIKSKNISVIFAEPGFSPRAVEMIAHDAKIEVGTLDPIESSADYAKGSYIASMHSNLASLAARLK